MKKQFVRRSIILGFMLFSFLTHSFEGGSSSGGGNFREIEFHSRVEKIINLFHHSRAGEIYKSLFDVRDLERTALELQVQFIDSPLFKDGVLKDALNFPSEKRVIVSMPSWDSLNAKPNEKDLLVFHELLGLMGVDDRAYGNSLKLLPLLKRHDQQQCFGDYQLSYIEGIWLFNEQAPLLMKIEVLERNEESFKLRVRGCDRAVYLHTGGECVPASKPDGKAYPEFTALYSLEDAIFMAPDYYRLKVDCSNPSRLFYEQDAPNGMGLSYVLRKMR